MRPCAIVSSFGIDSLCCKMKVWTYTSWICFKPWRLPATLYKHQPRPRFKHSLHPKLPGRSSIHASEWHALQGTFCLSRAMEAGKAIAVSAHNLLGTGQLLTTESGQPPATEVSKLRSPVWRDRGSGMLLRSSGNGLSTQCHHPRREQSDCVRSQAGPHTLNLWVVQNQMQFHAVLPTDTRCISESHSTRRQNRSQRGPPLTEEKTGGLSFAQGYSVNRFRAQETKKGPW